MSVKNYLTAILEQNKLVKSNWDQLLLEMCYCYNTSIHSATNFSTAKVMFGCCFRIPIDILYGTVDEKYQCLTSRSTKDTTVTLVSLQNILDMS